MVVSIDILILLKQALQANLIPFRCGTTKRKARILVTYVVADTSSSCCIIFVELAQELPRSGRDVQARWVAFQGGLIEGAVGTFVVVEVRVVLSEIQCVQRSL